VGYSLEVKKNVLKHLTNEANWGALATNHVGLHEGDPGEAWTTVQEPTGGAYARESLPAASFAAVTAASVSTDTPVTFTTATADWRTAQDLDYIIVCDALTGTAATNLLYFALVGTAKPVTNGDTAKILSGNLTVSIA
jgi:hypothetical protein